MSNCLIGPVKEIGKCIWPFLKPHVDYWWCFGDNIQQLKDGIRDLERQTHDIQLKIEEARNNAEILRPGVQEWLNSSIHKLEEARTTLPNDNIPEAWKLITRYSLGKNAKETAEEIAKLLNNGNFDLIADPAPPAAMASPPHRSTMDFESRKGIEEDIIKFLKESSVSMVGICGMAGVGKTTMAERITKRVKDENLFHQVVMVTVSQKIDMLKIQGRGHCGIVGAEKRIKETYSKFPDKSADMNERPASICLLAYFVETNLQILEAQYFVLRLFQESSPRSRSKVNALHSGRNQTKAKFTVKSCNSSTANRSRIRNLIWRKAMRSHQSLCLTGYLYKQNLVI